MTIGIWIAAIWLGTAAVLSAAADGLAPKLGGPLANRLSFRGMIIEKGADYFIVGGSKIFFDPAKLARRLGPIHAGQRIEGEARWAGDHWQAAITERQRGSRGRPNESPRPALSAAPGVNAAAGASRPNAPAGSATPEWAKASSAPPHHVWEPPQPIVGSATNRAPPTVVPIAPPDMTWNLHSTNAAGVSRAVALPLVVPTPKAEDPLRRFGSEPRNNNDPVLPPPFEADPFRR